MKRKKMSKDGGEIIEKRDEEFDKFIEKRRKWDKYIIT